MNIAIIQLGVPFKTTVDSEHISINKKHCFIFVCSVLWLLEIILASNSTIIFVLTKSRIQENDAKLTVFQFIYQMKL